MVSGDARGIRYFAIAALAGAAGFAWGIAVATAHVFPYAHLAAAKHSLFPGREVSVESRFSVIAEFPAHRRTLFIGDSIIDAAEWADIFPEASIANRGLRGDTTSDVLGRISKALETKPEVVVVSAGVNDPGHGIGLAQTRANLTAIVEAIEAAGASPVVMAPPLPGDDDLRAFVTQLNRWLEGFAARRGIAFVDPNPRISGPDGIREQYSFDALHPNGPAYRLIAEDLRPYVR